MQTNHTLAAAIVCALAVVACKETPPPTDQTAMTAEKRTTATSEPAMTSPISSPALPGPAASDATPEANRETPANASPPPTGDDATKESSSGIDSPATNPMGTLGKDDEQATMPLAGHGNNHSSPSIDQSRKD